MLKGIIYYCKCGRRVNVEAAQCPACNEKKPEYAKLSKRISCNSKRKWFTTEKPVSLSPGKNFNHFYNISLYDALEYFEKVTRELQTPHGYLQEKESTRKTLTVKDVYQQFIETRDLSNTKPLYDSFYHHFSHRLIRDIDTDEIESFITRFSQTREVSKNTYKHYISYISAFFTFCLKRKRIIQFNPCSAIQSEKLVQMKPYFLYPHEFKQFFDICCLSRTPRLHVAVLLCAHAGARANETEKLKYDDIDWHARTVKLQSKECPERKVELTQALYDVLYNYCKHKHISYGDYIIRANDNKRIFPRSGFDTAKRYLIDNGHKRFKPLTVHKLRHTFATWLYAKTKDILLVKDQLGHTDINTTMIYTHLLDNEMARITEKNPFELL